MTSALLPASSLLAFLLAVGATPGLAGCSSSESEGASDASASDASTHSDGGAESSAGDSGTGTDAGSDGATTAGGPCSIVIDGTTYVGDTIYSAAIYQSKSTVPSVIVNCVHDASGVYFETGGQFVNPKGPGAHTFVEGVDSWIYKEDKVDGSQKAWTQSERTVQLDVLTTDATSSSVKGSTKFKATKGTVVRSVEVRFEGTKKF
ncbi:MAG: hypothetical protein U0169_15695 [Polyangiaceae bacterium]